MILGFGFPRSILFHFKSFAKKREVNKAMNRVLKKILKNKRKR